MNIEFKERVMLADDLTAYINEKHTQEECIGFIDGYKSALNKLKKLSKVAVIKNEVAVYSCMQCNRKIDDLSKASNGWLCDEC
jgi:hypothetical protein